MSRHRRPVLFVGGGTAGHLAPGFAVAERLLESGVPVVFATPGERGEAAWFPAGFPPPLESPALRLPRRLSDLPRFPFRFGAAVVRAGSLLGRVRPGVVLGLGGWPCAPAAVAAWLLRVPLALVASDAVAGVAVRRLAPLARRLYLADARAARAFPGDRRVLVTGPVLRRAITDARPDPAFFGLEAGRRTLLVTGGSLGARTLNEGVLAGVEHVRARAPGLLGRLQAIHATGRNDDGAAARWAALGVPHHVVPFVREMGKAYATADLVVCRAGALTCAELQAVGRPAVLVPYRHHKDRQQIENARALVERGAAVLLEEAELGDAARTGDLLGSLLEDDERRLAMARRMGASRPDGALQIAADLVRLERG